MTIVALEPIHFVYPMILTRCHLIFLRKHTQAVMLPYVALNISSHIKMLLLMMMSPAPFAK